MAINWGVDHVARLVSVTATGELKKADIETYLDALESAATLSYRKIFDMGDCRLALTSDDIEGIGVRIRGFESRRPMGPLAVIAASDALYEQARQIEAVVRADRPMRILRDAEAAHAWLAGLLPASDSDIAAD